MKRISILIFVFLATTYSLPLWEEMGPAGGNLRSVVMSQNNENILYASTSSNGTIAKSTNGGATWSYLSRYDASNFSMAIDPSDILYAGAMSSIYKSTNNGVTWTRYDMPSATATWLNDIAINPLNPAILHCAGQRYITPGVYGMAYFKSTNNGVNWTVTDLGTQGGGNGYGIAVDPVNPNNIYLAGYDGAGKIYKSTDGGSNFSDISFTTTGMIYSIAVNPTSTNIIYAGTSGNGIWRSTNAGGTWTNVSSLSGCYRMKTTVSDPNVIYGSSYSAVFRSTDAGATWTSTSTGLVGNNFWGLAVSRTGSATAYVAGTGGCCKTTNLGANWTVINTGMNIGDIIAIGVSPSLTSTVYMTYEEFGVYKTTNSGSNWTLLPAFTSCGDMGGLVVHNTNPDIVSALEGYG